MANSEAIASKSAIAEPDTQKQFRTLMILGVMISTVSIVDRSVLNILAEPIKNDLGFSDTQLGLLTGFAFSLFYSAVGIPIARYVDRPKTDRPLLIAICVAGWSAATALSGAVVSYVQLLIARGMVAVGESGTGPAVMTLIDHYVRPEKRSRAFALYGLGIPLGTLIGLMLGGFLVDLVGWRWSFVIVGAPGIVLALFIYLFMSEPRRTDDNPDEKQADQPSLVENVRVIWKTPALMWLAAATALMGFFVLGLPSWMGVYLIRILDMTPTHAGLLLGLTLGIGGGLGTYFGGVLADRLSASDPGRALLVPAVGLLLGVPSALIAFLSSDWRVFAGVYWIAVIGSAVYFGPLFSMIQLLVKKNYRATTMVVMMLAANLIGAGLGPFLIGLGSDILNSRYGENSLRIALIIGQLTAVLPAFCYYKARVLAGDAINRVLADEAISRVRQSP